MKKLLDSFFANFKWYRRRQGGKWYKVKMLDSGAGIQGEIEYWTRDLNDIPETYIIANEQWQMTPSSVRRP